MDIKMESLLNLEIINLILKQKLNKTNVVFV